MSLVLANQISQVPRRYFVHGNARLRPTSSKKDSVCTAPVSLTAPTKGGGIIAAWRRRLIFLHFNAFRFGNNNPTRPILPSVPIRTGTAAARIVALLTCKRRFNAFRRRARGFLCPRIGYAKIGRFRGGYQDGRRRGGAWRFRVNLLGGLDGYKGGGVAWGSYSSLTRFPFPIRTEHGRQMWRQLNERAAAFSRRSTRPHRGGAAACLKRVSKGYKELNGVPSAELNRAPHRAANLQRKMKRAGYLVDFLTTAGAWAAAASFAAARAVSNASRAVSFPFIAAL